MSRRGITRRQFLHAGAAATVLLPLGRAFGHSGNDRSRLILLGTAGGPTPKPNRAAPAQAIVVGDACYVIDCGNGVARQMALAGLRLGSIRSVFITHHHSDHNADYGNLLLLAWASDLARRVDAYGPPPLAAMTQQFLALNQADIDTRMADEGRPALAPLIVPHEIAQGGVVLQDENVRVTAALVEHPPVTPSLAYRFDCPDRSIVISGDTRPSAALIELARGADVLVHEVMHVPSIEGLIAGEPNARTLREHLLASHTTTEQVGRVATEAGVKTLVLSHFVPGGHPFVADDVWFAAVRPHFAGRLIVGRDLLEI
jgi:ribonuclease BN (tRNA processing enzyme)